ncbi:hypothetical protein, conserved [Plasmodium ovale curtisi]|uniref:Uncharacterized protein n=1 Tax=Plasmodium ovale curtisi TaxID=864141 RepID=A0A1A8VLC2_PLAOA|nr:hypothetical protein, conserved [Plasmodium ovale curtisi]
MKQRSGRNENRRSSYKLASIIALFQVTEEGREKKNCKRKNMDTMIYLLDDKKIILRNLISKNEDVKRENENIELENKAFLRLIENYEKKKKHLNLLAYVHYVCTSLYRKEQSLNFNLLHKDFLSSLKDDLDDSIVNYKEDFTNILIKNGEVPRGDEEDTSSDVKKKVGNMTSPKSGIYDVNVEEMITAGGGGTSGDNELPCEKSSWQVASQRGVNSENGEAYERGDPMPPGSSKEGKPQTGEPHTTDIGKEKNICLLWDGEEAEEKFYELQSFQQHAKVHKTCLNLMEKQHLILREIEKIKSEIKKVTVHFENTKIIIGSLISQSKIFLFELEGEIKKYKQMKEKIKKDNFLVKKSICIQEFYNGIIKTQKLKMEEAEKTKKTLLNLYKKKLSNINYIVSINENINHVDFLYLHVLIYNKTLNYDRLMREHEQSYAYLRKLLNQMSTTYSQISQKEKKEKEIFATMEKNCIALRDIDSLIVDTTNKINSSDTVANKWANRLKPSTVISQYEHMDSMRSCTVLECIQMNRTIHLLPQHLLPHHLLSHNLPLTINCSSSLQCDVKKKIKSYERKIDMMENVKSRN